MATKKTLVLGASENPARYSNLAIKRLTANNQPVVALVKRRAILMALKLKQKKKHLIILIRLRFI